MTKKNRHQMLICHQGTSLWQNGKREPAPIVKCYLQNLCFPIVTVIGLDQIHLLVAVFGLK